MNEMIQRGRLPVTFEVDHMVENDDHRAINRLYRVLKAGAYVSQLAVVPTKLTTARYTPIFDAPKTKKRPYEKVKDIDDYLDHMYGPPAQKLADLRSINTNSNENNPSIQNAG
jgi:hypothetical protein